VRGVDSISSNLADHLARSKIKDFIHFPYDLVKADIAGTAQMLTFICGVDKDCNITEELLSMESLKDSTTVEICFSFCVGALIDTS